MNIDNSWLIEDLKARLLKTDPEKWDRLIASAFRHVASDILMSAGQATKNLLFAASHHAVTGKSPYRRKDKIREFYDAFRPGEKPVVHKGPKSLQ